MFSDTGKRFPAFFCSCARPLRFDVLSFADSLLVSLGLHVADVGCCSVRSPRAHYTSSSCVSFLRADVTRRPLQILRHAEWVYSCFPVGAAMKAAAAAYCSPQVVTLAVCDEAAARHLHAALKTVCLGML